MSVLEFAGANPLLKTVVSPAAPLPTAPQYGASGVDPLSEALVSSTGSTAWGPTAGRPAYLEITGAGSATVTLEYECLDGSFAPKATGTDGGAPIVFGKVAYAGTPIILSFETTIFGQRVRAKPGVVSGGTVTATFRT